MSDVESTEGESLPSVTGEPADVVDAPDAQTQDLTAFLRRLLEFQCRLIGAIGGAVYLSPSQTRREGTIAFYATEGQDQQSLFDDQMLRRIERIGREASSIALNSPLKRLGLVESVTLPRAGGVYEAVPTHRAIASPLVADGRAEGAAVLLMPSASRISDDDTIERLALTCARFESFLWQQQCLATSEQRIKLQETLEMLDIALQGANAEAMASLMCHELHRKFGCTRVSIGLIERDRVRLVAVSGADEIDRRGEAVQTLEAAMEESADQDVEILYPAPAGQEQDPALRRVMLAHETLSRKYGPSAVLSLPLRVEGDLVGVILLERDASDPFPAGGAVLLRLASEFIGPAVWTRRLADRGIFAVARDRTFEFGEMLVGSRHTGAKLLGLGAILLFLGAALIPIPAWTPGSAELAARTKRAISPPFIGYLASVHVRPGSVVKEGEILAEMDVRKLELELSKADRQLAGLRTQRDDALAKSDFTTVRAAEEAMAGAEADMAFYRERIELAQITAPLSGKIARGDLEAYVGAEVSPEQPLFEIVTQENLVMMQIDERDIGRLFVGQSGKLAVKSNPGHEIPIVIERISPVAQPVRSKNVYEAEARIDLSPDEAIEEGLRPGLTGSVRVRQTNEDGKKVSTTYLKRFLRPLVNELRLRLWW